MPHLTLTPPELARRWRVKASKIISFIKTGQLRAFDVSANPGGRPRFRINLSDVIAFENRRAGEKPTKTKHQRRQTPEHIIEFFK